MDKATLFISHSSKDALVATAFSDFMTHIGIPSSQITCSSAFGTHILTGTPLYSMLHQALSRDNVFFLMLLSDNYYSSAVCLNEMGAAWIKDLESLFFILPGFSFEKVKGVARRKRAPIVITNRRNDYCIPLKEFSRNSSDFTSVQEICFLFSRSSITDGKDAIEINIYNISLD